MMYSIADSRKDMNGYFIIRNFLKGECVVVDKNNKPKPDDRSDNVEKLQDMVQDTIQNLEESHDTMRHASGKEAEQIKEKNKRREEAIEGMREEIEDEHQHDQLND